MSVRPEDLVAFADAIVARPSATEVEVRAAVSRAYYGVLHAFCMAMREAIPLFDAGRHEMIVQVLKHHVPRTETHRRELGDFAVRLDELRLKRGVADYHLTAEFRSADAQLVLHDAKRLLQDAPRRGAIAAGDSVPAVALAHAGSLVC